VNSPIDAAKKRLADIEAEAEKLRSFIALWRDLADLFGDDPGDFAGALTVPSPTPDWATDQIRSSESPVVKIDPQRRTRIADNPRPEVLIPQVRKILLDRGTPMTRRELHSALAERGFLVRGTDPVKTLGTILWRAKDQIVGIDGHGYWPKNEPLPFELVPEWLKTPL